MDKEHDDRAYNGWTNYETWAVSLWLDNEETSYRYWRDEAARQRQAAADSAHVRGGYWTASEAAAINLAERLKDAIGDASPLRGPSMYGDLLAAALSEVNWLEIAEHWLNE